jgi:hypothetical protein
MSYVSENKGDNTLPLLFKGRVGEGLRKKVKDMALISQKDVYKA